jgi:hypothetical protein
LRFVGLTALTSAAQGQRRGGFDGQGHPMMHGTPRFVLGVYDSGGAYSTDPAFWENAIFSPAGPRGLQDFPLNVYLNYFLGGPTTDELRAQAVMAIVEGAHGLFWWDIGVNGLRQLDATTVSTYMSHLKRTALSSVCAAIAGACVAYADPLTPGPTVIQASHLNELRANVLALL